MYTCYIDPFSGVHEGKTEVIMRLYLLFFCIIFHIGSTIFKLKKCILSFWLFIISVILLAVKLHSLGLVNFFNEHFCSEFQESSCIFTSKAEAEWTL